MAFLSEYNVKDSMRAAACLIHVGGSYSPVDSEYIFISLCSKLQGMCLSQRQSKLLVLIYIYTYLNSWYMKCILVFQLV